MSGKMWLAAGGSAAAALGLSVWVGLRGRREVAEVVDPQAAADKEVKDLPKTLLSQALVRMAMHKKALAPAEMDRAFSNAITLKLPKTAATIRSIKTDGAPGGPNYSPLPLDENWPGTDVSVRQYISNAMKALSAQATA